VTLLEFRQDLWHHQTKVNVTTDKRPHADHLKIYDDTNKLSIERLKSRRSSIDPFCSLVRFKKHLHQTCINCGYTCRVPATTQSHHHPPTQHGSVARQKLHFIVNSHFTRRVRLRVRVMQKRGTDHNVSKRLCYTVACNFGKSRPIFKILSRQTRSQICRLVIAEDTSTP